MSEFSERCDLRVAARWCLGVPKTSKRGSEGPKYASHCVENMS